MPSARSFCTCSAVSVMAIVVLLTSRPVTVPICATDTPVTAKSVRLVANCNSVATAP